MARADRFDDYHEAMTSSIQRYVQQSTTIELIENSARHTIEKDRGNDPQPVGGKITPLDYDLGHALSEHHAYQLAKSRRDAARRAALMWAAAAQVEAEAGRRES